MMLFALLLQAATPPPPPPPAIQAQEMVDLFGAMCVEAAGQPMRAHGLDAAPAMARAMTAAEKAQAAPSGGVTDGWIVRSPHEAWGALWFDPARRTCGLTVRATPPAGMEAALGARLQSFYGGLGFLVAQRPDETATEGGVTVHRAGWTISAGTHELAVIASFADAPIGDHQHLMTFTLLH